MNELASGQREAELAADLATLRADLERRHNQGRDRRRDESEQLTQLANHNQRLVEQLAEVSMSVNSAIMSWKGFFIFFVKRHGYCVIQAQSSRGRVFVSAVQQIKRMQLSRFKS